MKKIYCVTILVTSSLLVYAQDKKEEPKAEPKISISPITATFMISTNFEAVCLNMVGTGIRYTTGNSIFSVTIFPTLVFKEYDGPVSPGDPRPPFVRPGFAVGPMFQYKKFLVGFPIFYQDDEWHPTMGIGVKIGR